MDFIIKFYILQLAKDVLPVEVNLILWETLLATQCLFVWHVTQCIRCVFGKAYKPHIASMSLSFPGLTESKKILKYQLYPEGYINTCSRHQMKVNVYTFHIC